MVRPDSDRLGFRRYFDSPVECPDSTRQTRGYARKPVETLFEPEASLGLLTRIAASFLLMHVLADFPRRYRLTHPRLGRLLEQHLSCVGRKGLGSALSGSGPVGCFAALGPGLRRG